MVLDVYIIKFKRLKIKELSAPLGNNPRKAKEGNYKDKNRNYETENKNAKRWFLAETLDRQVSLRKSEDWGGPSRGETPDPAHLKRRADGHGPGKRTTHQK